MKIILDSNSASSLSDRRRFLSCLAAFGASGALASWVQAEQDRFVTPSQTAGPYYPIPAIAKQAHNDADLTRKLGKDEVAKGEPIQITGRVVGQKGQPLAGAIIEVWQASADGRYNHPRDNNPTPLDNKFQYWGRMKADEEGKYQFTSIKPGEYPGRTPHIHFRVLAQQHRELVSQLYFAEEAKRNARDGIYRSLSRKGRDALTIELTKQTKPSSSKDKEVGKKAANVSAAKKKQPEKDSKKKPAPRSIRSGNFEIVLRRA